MGLRQFFSRKRPVKKLPATGSRAMIDGKERPGSGAQSLISDGSHTLKAFDQALHDLVSRIGEIGEYVTVMVGQSADIFLDRDPSAANRLIQHDLEVDSRKNAVIAATFEILARHQPVASDLRLILAIEHIAGDLERAADHAKNIAKRSLSLAKDDTFDPATRELLRRLHKSVHAMFVESMRAFNERDEHLADEVRQRDKDTDAIYDDLFHAIIAHIQAGSQDVPGDIQALFAGKSLERIGDHATNIAEEARFLARGDLPSATRQA
jgi:phosphate transport system protein